LLRLFGNCQLSFQNTGNIRYLLYLSQAVAADGKEDCFSSVLISLLKETWTRASQAYLQQVVLGRQADWEVDWPSAALALAGLSEKLDRPNKEAI